MQAFENRDDWLHIAVHDLTPKGHARQRPGRTDNINAAALLLLPLQFGAALPLPQSSPHGFLYNRVVQADSPFHNLITFAETIITHHKDRNDDGIKTQ